MTNFDFLLEEEQFSSFSNAAVVAEKSLNLDVSMCIGNCRRVMEMAIKWMYSVDEDLELPYQETLSTLMNTESFKDILDNNLMWRLQYIRRNGNEALHGNKKFTRDEAVLSLKNLFYFMDFISCCYGKNYVQREFDPALLDVKEEKVVTVPAISDVELQKLMKENEVLKAQLTARRESQSQSFVPQPMELSEYPTRKLYIDSFLRDAGWTLGKDWFDEVELPGMPNKSGVGFADYVLYDDAHCPLAVIEAKRTCVDVSKGRQQAKLYADLLEKKYRRRPVIFLSNGFETRIDDGQYPERKVSSFYSKRDLEKLFNLRNMKGSMKYLKVKNDIAGRYYQQGAVKAVCSDFEEKNKRKALLVMATGSGKTRTVIGLVDVMVRAGWIKNVLFLADRTSLVVQAKRSFVNLLPNLSTVNLIEDKENKDARVVFSTYQTMMNCIDNVLDEDNKRLFTCGHFDLIICDEAHRSIYNKYRDIFNYFDSPIVGLTATPKDEIDHNTYDIFELEKGVPTYGYELAQAVKDGYLVDFKSVESSLKFVDNGIVYDELSDEEKSDYENTFVDEDGEVLDKIQSSALNTWVFNEDTIKKVFEVLFEHGQYVDYGQKIGKTIVFAKNHRHAEKIFEVFNKYFPHLNGQAKVIDNYLNYAQSLIDEFSIPENDFRIAISVDMLDTGIDVPEVLNLVFFKKVMSKAKFWQMIGRGTRLSSMLIDGKDKEKFYIFDFCGNFEFFRMHPGHDSNTTLAVQGSIFHLKSQLVFKLQDFTCQNDNLKDFRNRLVHEMIDKVRELDRDNFAVKQHLKYVDTYANEEGYRMLVYEDTLDIKNELSPLILPDDDDIRAIRFDALMYSLEVAFLNGKKYSRARSDLMKKVAEVSRINGIDEVTKEADFIHEILHTDFVDNASIEEFEEIRIRIRDLLKFIPSSEIKIYTTKYEDDLLSIEWHDSELENDDLKNYRMKLEFYVKQHQKDNPVIKKLNKNEPLTQSDVEELEDVLWHHLGSKTDYEKEYGNQPLGELIRSIVGLDVQTAKELFAEYLNENFLNSQQIYFVNQIVEFIVQNGMLKDFSVLQESPFTDQGSIVDVFPDLNIWLGIKGVIDSINRNANC